MKLFSVINTFLRDHFQTAALVKIKTSNKMKYIKSKTFGA